MYNLQQTRALATHIANLTVAGDIIALKGDLGAGKTAFSSAFIEALGYEGEAVTSPTFTLVQLYDTQKGEVWHADLYRLSRAEEVEELGLLDAFSHAICVIEWPDIIEDRLPQNRLLIQFNFGKDADYREIKLDCSPSWKARLEERA